MGGGKRLRKVRWFYISDCAWSPSGKALVPLQKPVPQIQSPIKSVTIVRMRYRKSSHQIVTRHRSLLPMLAETGLGTSHQPCTAIAGRDKDRRMLSPVPPRQRISYSNKLQNVCYWLVSWLVDFDGNQINLIEPQDCSVTGRQERDKRIFLSHGQVGTFIAFWLQASGSPALFDWA